MEGNQQIWHMQLKSALWADRITPKRSTGQSPFMLVYGRKARLTISFELPTLDLANQLDTLEEGPLTVRLAQLFELEETRNDAMSKIEQHQAQMKRSFDKRVSPRNFQEGDIVLKWDTLKSKSGKHSKFDAFWSGPYIISKCKQHNAFHLSKLDDNLKPIPVNGIHLKYCF
ncbi:uncharacterized protein LOC131876102 [Cryptomeria japonica]|uniref:uncharacterized protein LOC131876102 n=1 Tax=Cryptomeria japonica TaxID=3369 RepID=UPI0027DA2585|nr:uncharacterized protein LOC131876102 [Cryptomeria japonica]